jgi:hypothetical protein
VAHAQLHLTMFFHAQLGRGIRTVGFCGVAIFLCARPTESAPARGSKVRAACAIAYKSALDLESKAQLVQAKETFATCMKAACGAVRQRCAARHAQLDADIPSVIPVVTDESGAARSDVQVTMDGVVLTSELDGRPLPVDPGLHAFEFATNAGVLATKKVLIVQGERNRAISVEFGSADKRGAKRSAADVPPADHNGEEATERTEPSPERKAPIKEPAPVASAADEPAPPRSSGGGPGAAPYLLGVVGVAGLGAYGAFTYWGKKDNQLLSQCSPNCAPSSLEHIRKLYLVADISLGVGVAALGAATWIALSSGSSKEKPSEAAYVVDVTPTRSGAYATVSGKF